MARYAAMLDGVRALVHGGLARHDRVRGCHTEARWAERALVGETMMRRSVYMQAEKLH